MSNQDKFRELSKEYAHLEPMIVAFRNYRTAEQELADAKDMLADKELKDLAQESVAENEARLARLDSELKILLIPKDPNDDKNIYLEVRAGTGGDEAAIFAGDLFRMYMRYAEKKGWQTQIISTNEGEHGGFKEVIALIKGDGCYGDLKFESGTHEGTAGTGNRIPGTGSHLGMHGGHLS
jgi:bacterial peptide chain release factor 1 (bRF-1)